MTKDHCVINEQLRFEAYRKSIFQSQSQFFYLFSNLKKLSENVCFFKMFNPVFFIFLTISIFGIKLIASTTVQQSKSNDRPIIGNMINIILLFFLRVINNYLTIRQI